MYVCYVMVSRLVLSKYLSTLICVCVCAFVRACVCMYSVSCLISILHQPLHEAVLSHKCPIYIVMFIVHSAAQCKNLFMDTAQLYVNNSVASNPHSTIKCYSQGHVTFAFLTGSHFRNMPLLNNLAQALFHQAFIWKEPISDLSQCGFHWLPSVP